MANARGLAVVTGASSGIGRELALLLAADGYDLVLAGRDAGALAATAAAIETASDRRPALESCDLARPGAAEELYERVHARGVPIEVLVNNAGIGSHGPFAASDPDGMLALVRLNVEALAHLTRLVLPDMIARGSGRVLNVASTAAFQPGPLMAAYYASKAFVLSLSVALSEETRGSGVSVSCLCPGPTRTAFHARAGMDARRMIAKMPYFDASLVAEIGYRGMLRGKAVVIPGFINRIGAMLGRHSPLSISARIVRRMQG